MQITNDSDTTIKLNYDQCSEFEADDLAASTLDAVKRFLMMPGGKETLDARIKSKKERSETHETRQKPTRACG